MSFVYSSQVVALDERGSCEGTIKRPIGMGPESGVCAGDISASCVWRWSCPAAFQVYRKISSPASPRNPEREDRSLGHRPTINSPRSNY